MSTAVIDEARKSMEQAPPAPKSVAQPFDDIMRRYSGMVYNRCLHITKNAADAEDATQAVFLTLSMHLQSAKQIKYVGPWLEQVAKRVSLNLIRSRKRRSRRENVVAEMRAPETIDPQQPDLDEVRAVIREEVNQLPTKYRLPLILHYFGDTTTEEIAKELGCTTNALCVRLHRGREMLRKRLAERGVVMSVTGLGLAVAQVIRSAVSDHLLSSLSYTAHTVGSGGASAAHVVGGHVATLATGALKPVIGTKLAALGAFITLAMGAGTWSGADGIQNVVQNVRQMNVPTMNPGQTLRNLFQQSMPRIISQNNVDDQTKQAKPDSNPLPPTQYALSTPTGPGTTSTTSGGIGGPRSSVGVPTQAPLPPAGPWQLTSGQFKTANDGYLPLPAEVGSRVLAGQSDGFRSASRSLDRQQVTFGGGTGPGVTDHPTGIDDGRTIPDMPGEGSGTGLTLGIPIKNGTGTYAWPDMGAVERNDPNVQFTLLDVTNASPVDMNGISRDEFATLNLPAGHNFVNVWSFGTTALFSQADFLVHYDEALVKELGLNEANLKMWVFDGEWKRIELGKDVNLDQIWGQYNGSGIAYVAISTPEPGAILSLGLGASYLLMRRRRVQK